MKKSRKKRKHLFLGLMFFFVVLVVYLPLVSLEDPPDISHPVGIQGVSIFDGEKMIAKSDILIMKGKVEAIGQNIPFPEGIEIIDGKGKTLLPGLIDAHVHVLSPEVLKRALIFGVTAVVDMFMDIKTMAAIKKMQESGQANEMAYLISSGTLATAPGGHGTEYGVRIPTLSKPEEAKGFVEDRIAESSDFIKIIYDEGNKVSYSFPTLDLVTIKALIEAAHKRGKIVIVHAGTLQNCLDVLEAGADGLAHLYFNNAFDPGFGRLAAKKKAFVIPTLSVIQSMSGTLKAPPLAEDSFLFPYLLPGDVQSLKQSLTFGVEKGAYEAAEKALRQLKVEDVPILAGTDTPNPGTAYGASLHGELELLVRAGLTPLEALRSATSIPAEKFHIPQRGKIKPGFIADCVLVNGNPEKDIKATRNIFAVWKNGVKVDREKYREKVEREKEKIQQLKNSPPPKNSESGWISDFEGEKITANFGAGWMISTDAFMGGQSKAQMELAKDGAEGSKGSLLIKGTILEGSGFRWAGAMFSPGPTMMAPANLSSKEFITFWAKSENKNYTVMIYTQSLGFMPVIQTFKAGPEWKEYVFPFKKFNIEGYDITGIFIGAYQEKGDFALQLDNVRLK